HPDAAIKWLEGQPEENQITLFPAMIYGLSRSSPTLALDVLIGVGNREKLNSAIPDIVNGAVQQGGFQKGEELLDSVKNRPDIDETTKRNLFFALTQKRVKMAQLRNSPMDSLQWLDKHLGEGSPAGPNAMVQIVAGAAATDPAATMQWLDQRAERLTPAQSVPGYTAALQAIYKQSPEQFTTWLTANQTHPAHDVIVEAYANDLIAHGRAAEAGGWVNAVKDEKTRQRMQSALAKSSEQTGKQP
ncbi:MAG TPA: hypothetical protein VFG14_01145, partial [Chthoniobacteraceae bacterium]|nr:hypothetical protein [Chthoniobacteraceae bacterium]